MGGKKTMKKTKTEKNAHLSAMDVFGLHHLKGPTADALDANSAFSPSNV